MAHTAMKPCPPWHLALAHTLQGPLPTHKRRNAREQQQHLQLKDSSCDSLLLRITGTLRLVVEFQAQSTEQRKADHVKSQQSLSVSVFCLPFPKERMAVGNPESS